MFVAGAVVWVVLVVAGFALSGRPRAGSDLADRVAVPMYWVAVMSAVLVGVGPLVPSAVPEAAGPTEFSIAAALAHIEVMAQRPHPIGSAANDDVRNYIAGQLRSLGLEPEFQRVPATDYYGGTNATIPVVNVMARIPGTAPTGSVVLVAHLDTVPAAPGANDNSSGVAVAMDAARALLAGSAPRNDVILLFTDGEEPAPRFGSTAFVTGHRWFDGVRFVVNLEAIGSSGPSMLIETNGPQGWVLDRYVESAVHPVAFSFLTEMMALIGGSNTDFAPFRDAGVPGVEFAYSRGSPIYHTPADTPDSVSRRTLQSHGANTVELVRHLAGEDLASTGDDGMVFFTVGRYHLVRYPTWLALPVVALAGLVMFVAAHRRRSLPLMARGAVDALARAVAAAIVAVVVWTFLAGWRSTMGIVESYLDLFGLAGLTAAMMFVPFSWRSGAGRRFAPEGVLAIWWVLGLVTAITVPGVSYLFAWPVLIGAFALLGRFGDRLGWRQLGPAALTVGTAAVVLVPAIDTLFQFAQPRPGNLDSQVLPTVAIPVFLIALGTQLALSFRVASGVASTDEPRSGALGTFCPDRSPLQDSS
ncbi:MAG: M28 family peptidase [Acidimicrobiales bacterium]